MSKNKDPDKIWITISETINLGNYESFKVEAGYTKSYSDENPKELITEGIDELRELINSKAKKIRKKNKK